MARDALRILIIDGDKAFRCSLKAMLRCEGYRVFKASNQRAGLLAIAAFHPDLIILDWELSDNNGLEMIGDIRRSSTTPIIVLSSSDQELEKIAALDAGADDFHQKLFNPSELLARIRAVMRRCVAPMDNEKVFKIGELICDFERRLIRAHDKPVHLTPTEYELLKIFACHAGKVVSREQLFQSLWHQTRAGSKKQHLLRVIISNLRNKIEPYPADPAYILTEPGIGYRLKLMGN